VGLARADSAGFREDGGLEQKNGDQTVAKEEKKVRGAARFCSQASCFFNY
jgi:hypothetical protein